MSNPVIKHITIPLPDGTITTYDLSSISLTTSGSGNGVESVNLSGSTVKVVYSSFLTTHPSVIKYTDTTSTSTPSFGDSFTAVDSVTRDTYGHVQKINLKTITLPSSSVTIDTALSTSSTNPVENRVVTNYKPGLVNQVTKGETFGSSTSALGSYASAHGIGTTASGNYQMAIGQYNYEDTNNAYAFIIGNGAQTGVTTVYSNAFTVDWSGNTTMFGNAFVKGDYIYLGPNDEITLARYNLGTNTRIDKTNMFAMAPFPSFKYQNGSNVGIVPIIGGIGTSQLTDGAGFIKIPWSRAYMRYGTTSQEGIAGLYLGNGYKAGVEDNAYGEMRIFTAGTAQISSTSTNKPYIKIIPPTLTGTIPNYTIYWPSRSGTLALEEYTVAGTYDSNGRVTIPNVAEIQFTEWVPDMGMQPAGILHGGGTGIGNASFSLPNNANGGTLALYSDITSYHPTTSWTASSTTTSLSFGGTFEVDRVNQSTGDLDGHGHIAHGETITYKLPSLGAGTGISIGSNGYTINHSNSVTAQTDYNKYKYKYDAQGHITASSHWVHTANGEGGNSGWIKIANFKIIGNYFNTPVTLICSRRGNRRSFQISIGFANANTTDPDLNFFEFSYIPSCVATVNTEAYLIKSATSTWDLYVLKRDNYEAFVVNDFIVGRYFTDHVTWTWTNEQTEASEITGGTAATNRMSLGMTYVNNYYGMSAGTDDTAWIRTTTQGILPYQSGSAGSGHSSIGTSTWYFANAYIDNIYGTLNGTATSANILNADAGSNITPVYFSGGVPVACKQYASGANFSIVPQVGSNGVMEIGRYIDFHSANTGTTDYDIRLDCSSDSNLIMTSSGTSQAFTIKGVLPRFRFQQTTSGQEYSTNVLVGYPANQAGINIVMGAGGNVIIGSGEYHTNFYSATKANDALDYWTETGENMYIGSDSYVMIQTNGQTIANRKSYIFGDNFNLAFGSVINFRIGNASSYYAGRLEAGTITAGRTWTLPDAGGTVLVSGNTSFTPSLTSGTKIGTITINGTATDMYCQTNTNTYVTQSNSTTSSYRALMLGYNNSTTPSSLTTTVTNQVYASANIYAQPSTGYIFAKSIQSALDTSTYLKGNNGAAIVNSTASDGSYVALIKSNSTNGKFTIASYQTNLRFQYTANTTISADTNAVTNVTSLAESGAWSFPSTIDTAGNITITKASGDTGFYATRSDTSTTVWMGVGSGGTNHGVYSIKLGKWMMYGDASSVHLNGNAQSASLIYSTLTNPTSLTTYYIPFHSSASSANKSLLNNNGLWYYTQNGTTSVVGEGTLCLGNSTASGTAGNKRGYIRLYGTGSGYQALATGNTSNTSYTATFPAKTGNVGLYTVLHTSTTAPSTTSGSVTVLSATSQYIYNQYDIIKVWIYVGSTSMIQQVDICCTTEALAKAPHYFPTATSYNTKYLYFTFSASDTTYSSILNFTTAGTSDSTKISIAKVIGVRFS